MVNRQHFTKATSYFEHLKLALQSYSKLQMLGQYSPLAAPYFLGHALQDMPVSAQGRGEALRHELHQSLATLWGGPLPDTWPEMQAAVEEEESNYGQGSRYLCQILELNYFNRLFLPKPQSQSEIYHDILHISRSSHDRRLKEATNRLGELLLQRIRPAVRQEKPVLLTTLIGRDKVLEECLAELERQHSVMLTGPGGIGKTALGIEIGEHWSSPALFWYTIRPTFNDHLGNLLFALGHFLHCQGVSNLWHQLIADGGQIKDFSRALGLIRTDLEAIRDVPLICIDEVDMLRPADPEDETPEHTQLLTFIEGLRNHVPLLLMGQRAVVDSDNIVELSGFMLDELQLWLDSLKISYTQEDIERLYGYTAGNPRLLELCIALYLADESSSGGTLSDTLNRLPQTAAVLPLWKRIQRRLSREERQLLHALSVFRSPAPQDAWIVEEDQAEQVVNDDSQSNRPRERLVRHRLVQRDGIGGVSLLPALRKVIYNELTIEKREQWHLNAARVRLQRGEYTAAVHHYIAGNRPEVAVNLWYEHRREEVQRGEGATALQLLQEVSLNRLGQKDAHKLALARGELFQLSGETKKIVITLDQVDWPADDEFSADADLLYGRALVAQGNIEAALKRFKDGLNTLTRLQMKTSRLSFMRCQVYVRQRELDKAWKEAQITQLNAEVLRGMVLEKRGHYALARKHYLQALDIAKAEQLTSSVADTYSYLGNIANQQQEKERALRYYQRSIEIYDQHGDLFSRERVRSNLATAYVNSGFYQESIQPALKAFRFFERLGEPFWQAVNGTTLAEAYAELGHLDEAEEYAVQVVAQEEPYLHPYVLSTIGYIRRQQKRYDESEILYLQAKDIAEMNEDNYQLAYIWRALSEIYLIKDRYEIAISSVNRAFNLFQALELSSELTKTNDLLQKILSVQNGQRKHTINDSSILNVCCRECL